MTPPDPDTLDAAWAAAEAALPPGWELVGLLRWRGGWSAEAHGPKRRHVRMGDTQRTPAAALRSLAKKLPEVTDRA